MSMNPGMQYIVERFHEWAKKDAVKEEEFELVESGAFDPINVRVS